MRSGNILDVVTRFSRVLRVGVGIMKSAIEHALKNHKQVKVINAIGNHDDHSAVFLSEILAAFYSNNPRVEIETKANKFHYHKFGRNLFGITHGNGVKLNTLGGIMTRDCIDVISDTDYRMWLTGHVHQDKNIDLPECTIESFRTLTPGDAWSHGVGHRSWRSMRRIDYHFLDSEIDRKTHSIPPSRIWNNG
jgi:hypothetical protein